MIKIEIAQEKHGKFLFDDSVSGIIWLHIPRVVRSSHTVGKNFSFRNARFRSLQLEEAHANEINHDIHLANVLYYLKVR